MIVMAFLHLALPHPVIIFTKIAGDANAFLCMLMIGVNINLQMDSKSFRCLIKHITVRYALSAVLAFLFYRYLPFSLEIRQAMAVIALAPSSSLALIFTMKLKGDVIMAGQHLFPVHSPEHHRHDHPARLPLARRFLVCGVSDVWCMRQG